MKRNEVALKSEEMDDIHLDISALNANWFLNLMQFFLNLITEVLLVEIRVYRKE